MRQTFWFNGGDHGGVVLVLEIVVSVGEMNRRVQCVYVAEEVGGLGLITCVWALGQPFGQTHLPWTLRTLKVWMVERQVTTKHVGTDSEGC